MCFTKAPGPEQEETPHEGSQRREGGRSKHQEEMTEIEGKIG